MNRDGFVFYRSFYEVAKGLSDMDRLNFYERIIEYWIDWIDEKKEWIAERLFILVKPQLDANNKKSVDWRNGGRPKKTTGYSKKKPLVIENENQRLEKNKPNEKEKDNNKEKNNIKEKDNLKENTYFENVELNNLFLEFIKNKNYTEIQIKLLIESLNNLSRSDLKKIKIVKRSLMKWRKGFFPLPIDEPETTADRVKQTEELVAEQDAEYQKTIKEHLEEYMGK